MTLEMLNQMGKIEFAKWLKKATMKTIKVILKSAGFKGYSKFNLADLIEYLCVCMDSVIQPVKAIKEVEEVKTIEGQDFFFVDEDGNNPGDEKEAKAHYRYWVKRLHPDKGGNTIDFNRMQKEYKALQHHIWLNNHGEYEKYQEEYEKEYLDFLDYCEALDLIKKWKTGEGLI